MGTIIPNTRASAFFLHLLFHVWERKEPEVIPTTILSFKNFLIYSFEKHFHKIKASDRYEVPLMIIKSYMSENT